MDVLEKIGKYKIIDKIGTGAMGVVYKGFDPKMGRYVAIKTMSPQYVNNDESRMRFYKEATAPAKLFHPNIVAIYDLDEEEGAPFIVMEFLDGLDLKYFRTARIRFSIPQILNILIQSSEGLDYAHKHGIIHRDVKPANIILQKNGQAKIVDFGIARLTEGTQQTRTGVALGTPAYMSSEQARGLRVDHRTDQYSMGVIAYELITGENPFQAENYTGVLYKIINLFPPNLTQAVPECPAELGAAIMRTIEKDRDARFPDLKAFSRACQGILQRFSTEESRLELTLQGLGTMETTALQEPYKVRLIRKYIKEFQFEAASRLLERFRGETKDGTLLQSLQTELNSQSVRKRCADLLKLGQDLLEGAEYDLALANFNEILELDPDNIEAITSVQKALRLKKELIFKEQIQPLLAEAERRNTAGAYLEAVEIYRKVLQLDPEYVEVRGLIEASEKKLERFNRIRTLTTGIHQAIRLADLTAALTGLDELEKSAPSEEELRLPRTAVWKAFMAETNARLAASQERDGAARLRDWLTDLFSHRATLTFFSSPAHGDEKNEFLQEIRRWVTDRIQAQNLDAAHMALGILSPALPRQPSLQALASEVENLRQAQTDSRQRQLVMEKKLADGIQIIESLLGENNLEEASKNLQELTKAFPGDKILAGLKEEIAESSRRQEDQRRILAQLDLVRKHLEADDTERAAGVILNLETAHPRLPELRALKAALEEKKRILQQRQELSRTMEEVRSLREIGKFEQGLELARKSIQRFPGEKWFLDALEGLQSDRSEQEKRADIRRKSGEIGELIDRAQFLKAGKVVFELKNRFAEDTEVVDILKRFHEQRFSFIKSSIDSAESFSASKAFDEARGILERAMAECPDSVDLQHALQENVVAEEVQKGLAEVRGYLTDKKYDLALATLEGLLARYPEESNIVRLHEEIRQQRNAYIRDSVQHARTFTRENDFERALSLLRTSQEIVPNASEIQDEIDEIVRQRDLHLRQRKAAAEESRLLEKELESAIADARKSQGRGNLFDALRTLEQFQRRNPRAAPRLEPIIREMQELIDVQMHLPETQLPPAEIRRKRVRLLVLAAAGSLVVVAVLLLTLLPRSVRPLPPPAEAAVLAIDLHPWGKILSITDIASGKTMPLPSGTTPLQVSLPPGRYRVAYRLGDQSGASLNEEVQLRANAYHILRKISPSLEKNLDGTVDEILKQTP